MALRDQIDGLAHIGIRVHDFERSLAFYEQLGFSLAWGPDPGHQVAAIQHPSGLELNFIINAPDARAPNILMDAPAKYAGITHIALKVSDLGAVEAGLAAAGVPISGRRGAVALFIRDPDANVIELASD